MLESGSQLGVDSLDDFLASSVGWLLLGLQYLKCQKPTPWNCEEWRVEPFYDMAATALPQDQYEHVCQIV